MAVININLGENDVININMAQQNQQTMSADELHDKLKRELVRKSNGMECPFWYEVFIDFSENFDDVIYPLIKNLPYDAAFDLSWGYLQRRDDYYSSPNYVGDLNEMLGDLVFIK